MSAFADRYDFRDPGLFSDRDFVYIFLFYKFPQEKFCGGFAIITIGRREYSSKRREK